MRRALPVTYCLLIVVGCTSRHPQHDPREETAIAAIEELGGRVYSDEERPGTPVVSVDFSGTRVGDEVLVHLQELPQLEIIDLAGTQVTDRGLVHLKGLLTLKRIRLTGTRVTGEGAQGLREAIGGVVIER